MGLVTSGTQTNKILQDYINKVHNVVLKSTCTGDATGGTVVLRLHGPDSDKCFSKSHYYYLTGIGAYSDDTNNTFTRFYAYNTHWSLLDFDFYYYLPLFDEQEWSSFTFNLPFGKTSDCYMQARWLTNTNGKTYSAYAVFKGIPQAIITPQTPISLLP